MKYAPSIELDWECWGLPLAVAFSRTWQQAIVRVGPLCLSWNWYDKE